MSTQITVIAGAATSITVDGQTTQLQQNVNRIEISQIALFVPPTQTIGHLFTQGSPADTWTVNHNLGRKPVVQLLSTGGAEMLGEILHTSDNQFIVYFDSALAGFASYV